MEALRGLNLEILPHPPYSPYIAPSVYYLFGSKKKNLKWQKFSTLHLRGTAIFQWHKRTPENWVATGMQQLPSRWRESISFGDNNGAYHALEILIYYLHSELLSIASHFPESCVYYHKTLLKFKIEQNLVKFLNLLDQNSQLPCLIKTPDHLFWSRITKILFLESNTLHDITIF